jgi:lipoic acid synthetase
MLARLFLEAILRLPEVAERGPRVRSSSGDVTAAEMLRRSAAMACRAVEFLRRLLVERRGLLEPRPDLVRRGVHAQEPTSLVSRLTRMEPSLPVTERPRRPEWMKVRAPSAETRYFDVRKLIHGAGLNTVCEEARCPNIAECWGRGTATFQILGDTCTRACRYCYVHSGTPDGPPDPLEPLRLAQTAATMGLQHVVVTSVDRDDLRDRGAGHFAATIRALKRKLPTVSVEVLTPDFLGAEEEALHTVLAAPPEVFNHNIETVRRLHRRMRGGKASYDKALWLLRRAKELAAYPVLTKSGIIVGLGETNAEVVDTMRDLRANGVDVVTIGQYLQPSSKHARIDRWVHPDEFRWFREQGEALGFGSVFAGPLVRSSYRADEQRHAAETGRGAVAY